MPRRARIMLPDIAVHVIQRGNDRADCFFEESDRNHVHLLVTADEEHGCARLMKGIGQLYAQYVNKRYGKCGHLWEGRFKSCLVQSEHYVLSCYRYVELNPVRAGLVRRADEYPWSSHAANGKGVCSELLTPHEEYQRGLAGRRKSAPLPTAATPWETPRSNMRWRAHSAGL